MLIGPTELSTLDGRRTEAFRPEVDATPKRVEPLPKEAAPPPCSFSVAHAPSPEVKDAVNAGTNTLRPHSAGETRYHPIAEALITPPVAGGPSDAAPTPAQQRVLRVMDQKPVGADETSGRKVEYLKNGTAEGKWARELLAKVEPATKDLPYEEAFKKYQEARKLRVDGMPGPETLRRLRQDGLHLPSEARQDDLSKRFFAHGPAADAVAPGTKAPETQPTIAAPAPSATEPKPPEASPAPSPETAPATPVRSPREIDREITAKEREVRALRGWGDPASDPIRREKIEALKSASKALVASPEYQAVSDLRAEEKRLKDLRSDWVWPGSESYHAERIRNAENAVTRKQAATQAYRERIEREEAQIRDDLVALSYPTLTPETRQRFEPQIATLNHEVAALRSELERHPGRAAYEEYASAKAALAALESDWVKTGAAVERIEALRGIIHRYELES